jgi:hypothetical protein
MRVGAEQSRALKENAMVNERFTSQVSHISWNAASHQSMMSFPGSYYAPWGEDVGINGV